MEDQDNDEFIVHHINENLHPNYADRGYSDQGYLRLNRSDKNE